MHVTFPRKCSTILFVLYVNINVSLYYHTDKDFQLSMTRNQWYCLSNKISPYIRQADLSSRFPNESRSAWIILWGEFINYICLPLTDHHRLRNQNFVEPQSININKSFKEEIGCYFQKKLIWNNKSLWKATLKVGCSLRYTWFISYQIRILTFLLISD